MAIFFIVFASCTSISLFYETFRQVVTPSIAGLVAGVTAIWKYSPEKNQQPTSEAIAQDNDKHQLNKS